MVFSLTNQSSIQGSNPFSSVPEKPFHATQPMTLYNFRLQVISHYGESSGVASVLDKWKQHPIVLVATLRDQSNGYMGVTLVETDDLNTLARRIHAKVLQRNGISSTDIEKPITKKRSASAKRGAPDPELSEPKSKEENHQYKEEDHLFPKAPKVTESMALYNFRIMMIKHYGDSSIVASVLDGWKYNQTLLEAHINGLNQGYLGVSHVEPEKLNALSLKIHKRILERDGLIGFYKMEEETNKSDKTRGDATEQTAKKPKVGSFLQQKKYANALAKKIIHDNADKFNINNSNPTQSSGSIVQDENQENR